MADNVNKQATIAYNSLCAMLDDRQWVYQKDEEKLSISCTARGDDLPIDLTIEVDAGRNIVSLYSFLPYKAPEDKRVQMAIAVTLANNCMVDGGFDFDFRGGNILFRMSSGFYGALLGKDMFEYMLLCACSTIDEYNDKFLMVAKQNMDIKDIIKLIVE